MKGLLFTINLAVTALILSLSLSVQATPSTEEAGPDTSLVLQNSPVAPVAPPGQQLSDIHDIYGPLLLPTPINWIMIVIIAAAVLATLGLLFLYLRRRRKKYIPPPVPAHLTALAELETAREFLLNNRSLIYAGRISEILRSYIERSFQIASTRQTTSEFLHTVQAGNNNDLSGLHPYRKQLSQCMQQCDMAKYAHKTADRKSMEEMEGSVRLFINSTKPTEEDN